MIEETEQRWDGQRRESNGQFGKGKRPRSAQSKLVQQQKNMQHNIMNL
ncbi:MAG: hypothetical protein KHX10_00755 [Clostridium sp.]|nr:hypothetical protein [Clostridium sp.]